MKKHVSGIKSMKSLSSCQHLKPTEYNIGDEINKEP